MENSSERKLPNLFMPYEFETESSLNPLASEFVPSYLKSQTPKSNSHYKMKSETTSTTTLGHREVVGDASYLHAQRQLFELLHQLGNKLMPLKAINVSLTPDGHGVNVQFLGEPDPMAKQLLDEPLCQNASLHLEMGERCALPRRLPNVLAANFMTRMGDVINDKMAWSDQTEDAISSSTLSSIKPEIQSKRIRSSTISLSARTDVCKSHKQLEATLNQIMRPKPSQIAAGGRVNKLNSRLDMRQRPGIAKLDSQHDKKSIKGTPTPRKSMGQPIKKGPQKLAPRGTYTSLIRQTEAQKRLSLSKVVDK